MDVESQSDKATSTNRQQVIELKEMPKRRRLNKFLKWTLKFLIFLLCLSGLLFQETEFLQIFFSRPTIINIEVETPNNYVVPAFTFCNLNPIQRSKYCEKFRSKCIKPQDMEEFCDLKPHLCYNNNTHYMYPDPDISRDWLTINEIQSISQNTSEFFFLEPIDVRKVFFQDDNWIISDDFYRQCFSDNLYFHSNQEALVKYFNPPLRGSYRVYIHGYVLDVGRDEMFHPRSKEEPGVLLTIHSPYHVLDPHSNGILMKPGHFYKIHIRLEKEVLLPHPFKTDCIDYTELWKANNKTGPRSKQMCEDACQKDFSMKCYGCEHYLAIFQNPDSVCDFKEDLLLHSWGIEKEESDDYRRGHTCKNFKALKIEQRKCRDMCKKECVKLKFPFTFDERLTEYLISDLEWRNFEDSYSDTIALGYPKTYILKENLRNLILVEVFIDEPEILVMTHKPQYVEVEIFSYAGGFMGCWLGISIWAFVGIIGNAFTAATTYIRSFKSGEIN